MEEQFTEAHEKMEEQITGAHEKMQEQITGAHEKTWPQDGWAPIYVVHLKPSPP